MLASLMESFFDSVRSDDIDFEPPIRNQPQPPQRSRKEQVAIRRQVEDILAEKQRDMFLAKPYL